MCIIRTCVACMTVLLYYLWPASYSFYFFIFIVNYLLHLNVVMTNVSEVWINLTSILSVLTWMFIPNWYHSRAVRNHVKLGISLRVLYCVVDTVYWLGRSLGDCRPALPKGWKYQMVKTQTENHVRRPVVWTNRWQIWVFFSFEVHRGTAGICHAGLWRFSKAL